MNVASLELCRDLFKLSGWDNHSEIGDWLPDKDGKYELRGGPWYGKYLRIPAYDLGYLLRKLPATLHIKQSSGYGIVTRWQFHWQAVPTIVEVSEGKPITEINPTHLLTHADTPEDAACKLAIELFQQGVLKREGGKA